MAWYNIFERLSCHPLQDFVPNDLFVPCICRNAGKESSQERLGGSVLDKIPFLHGCEDDDEDDSDEEDDFQGMATDCIDGPRKNKKSRVKVWRMIWKLI